MPGMNGTKFVASLLLSAATAGAIGYQLGRRDAPPAQARDPASLAMREKLQRDRAMPGATTDRAPLPSHEAEVARALRDPAYLQRLLAQYRTESEPDRKGALLALLLGVANPDVQRFALDLARSPDPATRRDGLALLAAFSVEDAPVRTLLVDTLDRERDPALLRQAVDLLIPAPLPREDAAPMLDALSRLRTHGDPGVRASSVLQSAQWESGTAVEELLHRALLDPEPQVRDAAVAGVLSSAARSDRLKDALLEMASNPANAQEQRAAAVSALHGFRLDRADHVLYRQAVRALPADDAGT